MLTLNEQPLVERGVCRFVGLQRRARVRRAAACAGVAEVTAPTIAGCEVVYELTLRCESRVEADAALTGVVSWADGVGRSLSDGTGRFWRDAVLTEVTTESLEQAGRLWSAALRLRFEVEGGGRDA